MKKLILLITVLLLGATISYSADFSDSHLLYGWDGSAQFYQTWADHKTQLGLVYEAKDSDLSMIASLSCSTDQVIVRSGATWTCGDQTSGGDMYGANNLSDVDDVPTSQVNLDLEPGVDIQINDADLTAIAGLSCTADQIIIRDGTTWICGDQTPGGGGGDMLSTNNLSDVESIPTSRANVLEATNPTAASVYFFDGTNYMWNTSLPIDLILADEDPTVDGQITGDSANHGIKIMHGSTIYEINGSGGAAPVNNVTDNDSAYKTYRADDCATVTGMVEGDICFEY